MFTLSSLKHPAPDWEAFNAWYWHSKNSFIIVNHTIGLLYSICYTSKSSALWDTQYSAESFTVHLHKLFQTKWMFFYNQLSWQGKTKVAGKQYPSYSPTIIINKFINEVIFHRTEPEASQLGTEVAPRTQHPVLSRNQVRNLLLEYQLSQF